MLQSCARPAGSTDRQIEPRPLEALRRIAANTVEKRLLDGEGRPKFQVSFYVLDRRGQYAGVSLYASVGGKPVSFAVCTERGPATRPCEGLFGEMPPG